MIGVNEVLTVKEIAMEMRCSIAHVYNVINGRVRNVSRLPSIQMGRRKVVQRSSFEEWKRRNEQGQDGGIIGQPETGIFGRGTEQINA
jgi:hypothetical protein